MSLTDHGLPGDRSSLGCVGPARALCGATNARRHDQFVAPGAALADPQAAGEMNERLPHRDGRAYLSLHVRR